MSSPTQKKLRSSPTMKEKPSSPPMPVGQPEAEGKHMISHPGGTEESDIVPRSGRKAPRSPTPMKQNVDRSDVHEYVMSTSHKNIISPKQVDKAHPSLNDKPVIMSTENKVDEEVQKSLSTGLQEHDAVNTEGSEDSAAKDITSATGEGVAEKGENDEDAALYVGGEFELCRQREDSKSSDDDYTYAGCTTPRLSSDPEVHKALSNAALEKASMDLSRRTGLWNF